MSFHVPAHKSGTAGQVSNPRVAVTTVPGFTFEVDAGGRKAPPNPNTILVPMEISDALCASIICTALEGGIGYWCAASKIVRSAKDANGDWNYVSFKAHDTEAAGNGYGKDAAFHPDVVDYATIRRGIELLFNPSTSVSKDIVSWVLADIKSQPEIEGNIDADAADVVVQLGLLGIITFG